MNMQMLSDTIINEAYKKQKEFVKEQISVKGLGGFKAAVSSKIGQKKMGLNTLIAGVLYKNGEIKQNTTIELSDFTLAKVETEIGYRLAADINEKVSAEDVKQYVQSILPVIEVPDITLEESTVKVPDIIANNGFSSHYVLGTELRVDELDPNTCVVKLYHNNELISEGNATDAMDNQWEALATAINMSLNHGYQIQKGHVIITGALGKILIMQQGAYFAEYGALGTIKFTVK